MTNHPPFTPTRKLRKPRKPLPQARGRRGVALLLLLFALVVGVVLSMGFLQSQATTIGISDNLQKQVRARMIAESGLSVAVANLKANTSWRTDYANGAWVTNQSLCGGTCTVRGEDGTYSAATGTITGDGDLTNNAADSVTLTSIGTYSGVTHTARTTVKCAVSNGNKILLVVPDSTSLGTQGTARKALLVGWGYTVTLISETATQSAVDAALASLVTGTTNAAVYIAANCTATNVAAKFKSAAVGVVNEVGLLADDFGITSADATSASASSISITNNTHYITNPFSTGSLTLTSSSQPMWSYGGTLAASGSMLGGTSPGLFTIDSGGILYSGSTYAAGRRVAMPWGGTSFDIATLTANGKTVLKRALEWAALSGGDGGPVNSGFQTAFGTGQKSMDGNQVATQVVITRAGTLTGMTAYVNGPPPKLVRYAVYTDSGGEPGTLLAQTATGAIINNQSYWHTLTLPATTVSAGTYWLALGFEHSNEYYFYDTNSAGKYRVVSNDSITNGFKSSWGTSSTSGVRRISIYANITPSSTTTTTGGGTTGGTTGTGGAATYSTTWREDP
jgi:Tfp pilus assembly protein PilX